MRTSLCLSLSLFISLSLFLATPWADSGLSEVGSLPVDSPPLTVLLQEAARNNPALLAAREGVNVAATRLDQVSALPDPQLSINVVNLPIDSLKSDVTPMSGLDFKLAQMFPFPGKLSTKRELAHQKELWAAARYADLLLQVRQQVRDNWFKLSFQRQAIDLTQANIKLLDDFIRLTETRYEVGKGLQQNVLKAQVERSRLFDRLLDLQKNADISLAQINSLVGRATRLPLDDLPEPVERSFGPTLASLQRQAREHRPMFKAFNALIKQFEQKNRLAKLDYRPDFKVWAGYRMRNDDLPDGGTNFVSGGVSFNLPFPVTKRRAAVQEADAGLRRARQQRYDFARQVDFELHRSLTELRQAQKRVDLYSGGIIPQADQAYKATLAAYQVDKVDFLSLTDSLMTLYRFRIDLARAISTVQRSTAHLLATTGLDSITPSAPSDSENSNGPENSNAPENSTMNPKEDPHA